MPTGHRRFLVGALVRHVRKSAQKDCGVVAERPSSVGMVGEYFAYRIVPDGMAVEQGNHQRRTGNASRAMIHESRLK
jgi:hypothetical protein